MKTLRNFAFCSLVNVPLVAAAQAPSTTPPPLPMPKPRPDAAVPATIEPLQAYSGSASFLHEFTLGLDAGSAVKRSKSADLPARTEVNDTTVTLGFRAGQRGFGSVSFSTAKSSVVSRTSAAFFAIPLNGSLKTDNYRITGGYFVAPGLALGASYGKYDVSGSFIYNSVPPLTATSGNGPTYSLFATGFIPLLLSDMLLTYGVGYHKSLLDSTFVGNIPPTQSTTSTILTTDLGVLVPLNEAFRLRTGVTLNHTVNQGNFRNVDALDKNWLSATLGLSYALSKSLDVNASVSGWLNSNKNDYSRASVGLLYKF